MAFGRPNLGQILLQGKIVDDLELERAVEFQRQDGCRLGEALIALGICSDEQVARALSEQLELPFVDLQETPPLPNVLALIPRELALDYGVLPIRMEGKFLLLVARDPFDIRVDEAVRLATECPVKLAIAPESQLRESLHQYYGASSVEEVQTSVDAASLDLEEAPDIGLEKLVASGEKLSAVRVVNTLLADAIRRGASDLHVEPEEGYVRVRYRIDGRMCPVVTLPRSVHQSVVARVKIMCGMDISESRRPQDGSCRVRVYQRNIELRGSVLTGIYGEIIVVRILAQDQNLQRLDAVGFDLPMLTEFRRLLAARQGLILITGPTGSGKTTTLYGALGHLNRDDVNIITVEDPVEIKLPGINQVEVHDRAGRSFASTLRAILRQDPDIVMVGEMRDLETSDIGCRAALTGHLVLSTLHTLDALSTVVRMSDMGVAPYILGASLHGILAQRLVRRVCDGCAVPYDPPSNLARALEAQYGSLAGATFRRGAGCVACHHRGTRGRVGVFELLTIDEQLRHMIAERASLLDLRNYVRTQRGRDLEGDAFAKAFAGITPPEEVVNLGLGIAMAMEGPGKGMDDQDLPNFNPADFLPHATSNGEIAGVH